MFEQPCSVCGEQENVNTVLRVGMRRPSGVVVRCRSCGAEVEEDFDRKMRSDEVRGDAADWSRSDEGGAPP